MTAAAPYTNTYQAKTWHDPESWDNFVRSHTDCVYFRWSFREVIQQQFGHKPHYLAVTDHENQLVAVLPLIEMKSRLFGHFGVSLPFVNYGGMICSPDHPMAAKELFSAAGEWAKLNQLQHLTLRQDQQLTDCAWPLQTHKIAMLLELPESGDLLMKSIKSKLRAQVRRPTKEGAIAKRGGVELLDDFYSVFARNMRDLGTPVYSRNWFKALLETSSLASTLVIVYLEKKPVAAAFLIRHGDTMEIPWASSLREFNRFSVNMLLYWESLCCSIEKGCRFFDFGRSNKESPTYRFKKQWGAEEKQLYWYQWTPQGQEAVRIDPQNSKFALATKIWQKLPLPIANLLGPGLVKNIP
ncbi:FemAB family PEP-CTERM system-associated protein [Pseudomaricurvus alcaniphilus]|uniref:FemAB family XrtA/PEP-CTERM system-associated protein n=1 Tax=Pseudomaricurvus alcaniphilus TaxID=1166482 RepID=UPI001409109B|nr:FemAB family XrtA/PEP-CTERM system-associated protein [Pseudomaricurvus alcaniphilus]NHN36692.1 FemAB family PEP-CTERM system-associated protein [Pseudomaricurvus alcaniphilus]